MLSWVDFLLATGAAFLGSAVQGSVGFGVALIASPLLLLINGDFIPVPFILASFILHVSVIYRESHVIQKKQVTWAVLGLIPGSLFGGWVTAYLSQDVMELVFSALVLLAVLISAAGFSVVLSTISLFSAGLLSGVMTTIATIGGPPLALVYKDADSPTLRANLSTIFLFGSLISLTSLLLFGEVDASDVIFALALVPGMLLGFLFSSWILPAIRKKHTRLGVLTFSALSALMVILRRLL